MECFYVNDRKLFLNQSFSVNDLLVFLNLNIDLIVIEYNKIILPKSLWKQTMIKNNDEVEFVTIVGGG
jgi:thiamine biosynthesis protein ThiS|tara:strand:+ start:831 stop:1034 length:204 start_codon:yes stop_codon:yes gene_type:complete